MRRITSNASATATASNGNGSATAPADADKAAAAQQAAADIATAGARVASKLNREIVRRTLMSAVNSVKRADIVASASDPHARACERITSAGLATLASDLATLAENLATLADASYKTLKSVNVGTKSGSVSALALLLAVADASSKADALAQFAGE